ncbi:MAG: pyridoxamine 5'-phosphate oxidase family protein [Clostridiales Family XIII bacterium]|nr:pyridoxamine 5'-phosphate oxidase family protein [Clostridiales Family XIII bacterium]
MFREMRRNIQALPDDEIIAVLNLNSNGVLACRGDDDYPYAVPLNYIYFNKKIYFHSAKLGHKLDSIVKDPKVSFAVIDEDTILSETYTSAFRSVIAFGKARITENPEHTEAFMALVEKYSGDQPEESKKHIVAHCERACIVAIDIEHLTGKQAKEFVK